MGQSRSFARVGAMALGTALALSGCALVGPPYAARHAHSSTTARHGVIAQPRSASTPTPPTSAPGQMPPAGPSSMTPPPAPHFELGPAAQALVADARGQEHTGHYALAAQTLERAVSIEPSNPLVWLALSRERLAAGHTAQSYGMARKALYLASGDVSAEASAWGQIAATLRAEGHDQAALTAEHKAAQLSVQE